MNSLHNATEPGHSVASEPSEKVDGRAGEVRRAVGAAPSAGSPNELDTRPLRILMVIQRYPPELGGTETQAARLSAALRARGLDVEVMTLALPGQPAVRYDEFGTKVHAVGPLAPRSLRTAWLVNASLRSMLAQRVREKLLHLQPFDVLHFHLLNSHAFVGAPIARLLGFGTVVKIAGSGPEGDVRRHSDSPWRAFRFDYLKRTVDRFIALNPETRQELAAAGVPETRIAPIPNGLDTQLYAPVSSAEKQALRARLGWPDGPIVLFTGTFRPIKRLDVLVEGFARALKQAPDATLVLVGEGEKEAELRALLAANGAASRVIFYGPQKAAVVRECLQAADVFSLVSDAEGISNSLLEAMAVALPSLVTDNVGNSTLIDDNVHGRVIPVGGIDACGQALVPLLTDAALRARLGSQARARVMEGYAMDAIAATYEALYRQILRERAL